MKKLPQIAAIQAFMSLLLIMSLALAGCSVQLIGLYDQQTDEGLTALQKKTNIFLVRQERLCGTPDGAYAKHTDFYDEVKGDLVVLQTRTDAIPKNQRTSDQIKLLKDSFDNLEQLHRLDCKPEALESARNSLNILFEAILKLEVAKKRT